MSALDRFHCIYLCINLLTLFYVDTKMVKVTYYRYHNYQDVDREKIGFNYLDKTYALNIIANSTWTQVSILVFNIFFTSVVR